MLRDYRSAVTEPHLALGVSALDVLRALTSLASTSPAPSTEARFDLATLERLAGRRDAATRALAMARAWASSASAR